MATWQHLRSSTANKRPTTSLADGRIAINTNTASPGLFFKDSAGTGIVKVGPVHVGTTAPNSVPAAGGSSGNYLGEQWLDTSVSPAQMKVWNGSTWVGIVADELPVSKLQDGAPRQLIQTDAAGTGVEWTSNVDVPGTLDVTSTATFDSIASHPLGSAAAPTITFTGDTNTGIYSPGADQVAISTNGTQRLTVDQNGNLFVNSGAAYLPNDQRLNWRNAANSTWSTGIHLGGDNNLYINDNSLSNSIVFRGGAGERMMLDSSGRLGLGTSSPNTILTIGTNTPALEFYDADSAVDNRRWQFYTSGTLLGLRCLTDGGAGGGNSFLFNRSNEQIQSFQGTKDGSAWFHVDNSTARLGVGTTSPANTLHVVGTAQINTGDGADALLLRRQFNNPIDLRLRTYDDSAKDYIFRNDNGTLRFIRNATEVAQLDASGRFLVGTSSTLDGSETLQVNSTSAANVFGIYRQANDATGPRFSLVKTRGTSTTSVVSGDFLGTIRFQGSDGTDAVSIGASIDCVVDTTPGANDMPGRLVFSTTADGASSPTERARFTSNGYFKASRDGTYDSTTGLYHELNSNSDGTALFVRNSSASLTSTNGGIYVRYSAASPNSTTSNYLYCDDNSALRASIRSNGGLANYQANNVNLSDRNAKKDISPAAGTWDCIKEWEIVNYRYKDQPDDADLNLGVIAQQVAESCPEVITVFEEAKDDQPEKLGVKEQQMYWMAIKALQEAQVRIEQLEAKVAALESA